MARKQLEAYNSTKAERRESRRRKAPQTPVFDARATQLTRGVVPAEDLVPDVAVDERTGVRWNLKVIRNLRDDVLGQMRAAEQIDEHQYQAGRHWEGLWKRAEIGGVKAMDTTKEPVDGGGQNYEPLTDKQRMAVREMRRAEAALGSRGAVLVNLVLCRGWSITAIAEHMGAATKRDKLFYGRMFRDCLDVMAVEFGYADRKLLDRAVAR